MNQTIPNVSTPSSATSASARGDRAPRVAIVSASWHADLVGRCREAAQRELATAGPVDVETFEVPGAFEIPLHAMKLARSGRYDAVLACALVVDGGIYRHDFVAQAVIDGLMRVQLDTGVPVFSAVLTPLAFHEHAVHHAFFHEHLVTKGVELAHACRATLAALRRLEALSA
ncbi:MAG: 6,7-dimethyl-8-ribityllumazine synthase [Mitsuaria chitosanitabida]|uniref:6,7-dimethyl-8-ribityllumazine synthase n=1 Tax=Roseateles chitosanitabidus TaxID=65048 RepID=UPI001B027B72|nr:6,7-dimethyl-8-ribityllumazine synthase [Roseateles chitosanitabidus]MBO9686489.1 6,7-dimethyl-8-ribityllumazine synthase [Roseateles chitosanitabidus]